MCTTEKRDMHESDDLFFAHIQCKWMEKNSCFSDGFIFDFALISVFPLNCLFAFQINVINFYALNILWSACKWRKWEKFKLKMLQIDNQMHLLCSNLEQTRKRALIKFQFIREKSSLFKNMYNFRWFNLSEYFQLNLVSNMRNHQKVNFELCDVCIWNKPQYSWIICNTLVERYGHVKLFSIEFLKLICKFASIFHHSFQLYCSQKAFSCKETRIFLE